MDFVTGAIGVLGALPGLFGRKQGPNLQQMMFDRYSAILDEAMRIYSTTDLEATDKASLEQFRTRTNKDAELLMNNYSAKTEAAGYGPAYTDTEKTRTLGRFANEAARDTAAYEADLMRTRPQRKAGLLPNPGAVAGGFNMASQLDSYRDNLASAEYQSMLQLAGALAPILKRRGSGPSGGGSRSMGQMDDLSVMGNVPDLSFLLAPKGRGRSSL